MAAAAGVGLVELDNTSQWHRGCGNGMIVGNVGMVVLSVLSSISPKEDLQAELSEWWAPCAKYIYIYITSLFMEHRGTLKS